MIPGICCSHRLGVLASQLRGVDAGQADPLSAGRPAGAAVVAAADRHAGGPALAGAAPAQLKRATLISAAVSLRIVVALVPTDDP